MKHVALGELDACLVSDEDFDELIRRRWFLQINTHTGNRYVYGYEFVEVKSKAGLWITERRKIYMHRWITCCPKGWKVDHWDRDTLNNQRWNLRITTGSHNNANQEWHKDSECGFRGVSRTSRGCRFRARICIRGVEKQIGVFDTVEEAARAYDAEAIKMFGEFAWLNFDRRRDRALMERSEEKRLVEEIPW